jgi:hypothetical protein
MFCISDYNQFFIKRIFNLPEIKLDLKNESNNNKRIMKIDIECDKLFYAIFNKMNNYDVTHIEYNKINERQEKIKIAENVEKMDIKIKNKEKTINNLMYDNNINMKTFNILCMFYKINVLFIKDNTFIKMYYSDNPISGSIIMNENYQFIDTNNDITNKFEINLDKPIKCVSYYKLNELKEISKQLHLPYENFKKQQLYDSIVNIINKLNIS